MKWMAKVCLLYIFTTKLCHAWELDSVTRGKDKLEQMTCEQFLLGFEISRAFLRAKQARWEKNAQDFNLL